jgi:hypothetical protein
MLKWPPRPEPDPAVTHLEAAILERLPERSIIEVLGNVQHWTGWTRHFGPLTGSDPKLDRPTERYILTTFAYGACLPATAMWTCVTVAPVGSCGRCRWEWRRDLSPWTSARTGH